MTKTLAQFAQEAARDLGVMRPGMSLSADMKNDILARANEWLDGEVLNRNFVYAYQDQLFNLTGGKQTYKIGPVGADFTAPRPEFIEAAGIVLNTVTPNVRVPLKVIHVKSRAAIPVDNIPTAIPKRLYYDHGFDPTNGFGTLFFWPGPLLNYQFEMWAWPGPLQQINQFADLTTAYNFPPGYAQVIRCHMAVICGPMMRIYSKLPKQEYDKNLVSMQDQARRAWNLVESFNAPDNQVGVDRAFLSSGKRAGWNYATGDYNS